MNVRNSITPFGHIPIPVMQTSEIFYIELYVEYS